MREVEARRIVAAAVEQHQGLRRQGVQRRLEGLEVDARAVGLEIGVLADFKAVGLENRNVVAPGRVGNDALSDAEELVGKSGCELQGARAAQRLNGRNAARLHGGVVLAENELLHARAVLRHAGHRHVAARQVALKETALGLLDALHQGQKPGFIEVDADAEINLRFARILLIEFHKAKNGIVRHGGESCKIALKHSVCFLKNFLN